MTVSRAIPKFCWQDPVKGSLGNRDSEDWPSVTSTNGVTVVDRKVLPSIFGFPAIEYLRRSHFPILATCGRNGLLVKMLVRLTSWGGVDPAVWSSGLFNRRENLTPLPFMENAPVFVPLQSGWLRYADLFAITPGGPRYGTVANRLASSCRHRCLYHLLSAPSGHPRVRTPFVAMVGSVY